jgi:hypothetical protein
MAVLKNRAKMSTSTTGTGTITLGSAEDGYQTFADAGVANADVVRYVIEDTGGAFEIGTGTYTSSGTTLSRTVSESSNSNNAINLSGSATVFIGATAEDIPETNLYAENYDGTSTKPTATGTNSISIGRLATASGTTSFAAGNGAEASGLQSVSIGYQHSSNPTGEGAANYGRNSNAAAPYSTAIGANSAAAGSNSFATALTKSYASGASSFAAAIDNNTSSYGASGAYSISLGKNAKSTANYATAIGESTQALGNNSVCLGYNSQSGGQGTMVMGYDAQSTAVHCTSIGTNTRNAVDGTFKFSGGKHSASGDAQVGIYPVLCETTDATATTFVTYHSNTITPQTDNQIVLPNNSAYAFSGTIVARQKASEGTACAAWEVKGLIRREGSAGTTVLVNSATTILDNTPNWGLALSADTTNGCLKIQGTGASSTNIRWSSTITTSELTYA